MSCSIVVFARGLTSFELGSADYGAIYKAFGFGTLDAVSFDNGSATCTSWSRQLERCRRDDMKGKIDGLVDTETTGECDIAILPLFFFFPIIELHAVARFIPCHGTRTPSSEKSDKNVHMRVTF